MGSSAPEGITRLLRLAQGGGPSALDRLAPRIYEELQRIARGLMRHEVGNHTLQATALVSEAWIRIARQEKLDYQHRGQFFQTAATLMRRILVDHARSRASLKRGGAWHREPFDDVVDDLERTGGDLAELEEALDVLAETQPRAARLIELRFFVGLGMREASEILNISLREAERDWTFARAWLRRRLDGLDGS